MSGPPFQSARLTSWRKQESRPSFVQTLDHIQESGWQAMLVSGQEQANSFGYTIGLYDMFAFPELITVGLPLKLAHAALEEAVSQMKDGVDLSHGRHREVIGNVEVIFRPVSRTWYQRTMYRTDWYYGEAEIPALQLIYPDLENRFQWEPDFNEYFRQPMFAPDALQGSRERDFVREDEEIADWKFPMSRNTNAFLSKPVFEKKEPVVYVSHDRDGAWQFLGDSMSDNGGPVLTCLHHPIDEDASLEELHDLPLGWYAERALPGEPWYRYELPPDEEESAQTALST